jgi:uncharacterized protein YaiI (UPF0178 family)
LRLKIATHSASRSASSSASSVGVVHLAADAADSILIQACSHGVVIGTATVPFTAPLVASVNPIASHRSLRAIARALAVNALANAVGSLITSPHATNITAPPRGTSSTNIARRAM